MSRSAFRTPIVWVLAGSREMAAYMKTRDFRFEYLEVDGDHGGMVPIVWPRVFEFFNRHR